MMKSSKEKLRRFLNRKNALFTRQKPEKELTKLKIQFKLIHANSLGK